MMNCNRFLAALTRTGGRARTGLLAGLLLVTLVVSFLETRGTARSAPTGNLSVTESLRDTLVCPTADPLSCAPVASGKFKIAASLSLGGVDLTQFNATTAVTITVGDTVLAGVLGDDPHYTPGATAAQFTTHHVDARGKTIVDLSIALKWSAKGLKVKIAGTTRKFQEPVLADRYFGLVTGPITDATTARIEFGAVTAEFALPITGKASTKSVTKGTAQFVLHAVTLKSKALRVPAITNQAPAVNAGNDQAITLPADAGLHGTASDDGRPTPPATLTTTWSKLSGPGTVNFSNAATLDTSASFTAPGVYVLRLTASDSALSTSDDVTVTVGAEAGLPVDPGTIAPSLPLGNITRLSAATAFLYTGTNAIQTGVAPGALDPQRSAVLRGRTFTRTGAALPGVTITLLGHPEFGQTKTRVDGQFDLAVNGGSLVTVKYDRAGYLPVQRQITPPPDDYATLPDVVLLTLDTTVTDVTLGSSAPEQVARGSVQTDQDGTRQATLIFPAGTSSSLLVNGATQAVSSLSIRATEFTVGATGPAAMPAQLPANSGYTYCVELSADEALAAGATTVQFDRPVPVYVENFLGFPVGQTVPVGTYDRQTGQWLTSANGRVIKILSISAGAAVLDTDGDGLADNAGQLAALGITDAERQRLATLYAAGQTLWRVGITHFSFWDFNWPFSYPSGASSPKDSPPNNEPPPNSCEEKGNSVIKTESQVFAEDLPLVGTPFRLHYESDRVLGNKNAYTLAIPLTEATLPPGLKRVTLVVEVAGQYSVQDFPALPNQNTSFTWDGNDPYGRFVPGRVPINVHIGYVYKAQYYPPSEIAGAFSLYASASTSAAPARQEVFLWKDWAGLVGVSPSEAIGLGAWMLDVHHTYDPRARALYMGDGAQLGTTALDTTVIKTFAGTGDLPGSSIGDGGQASLANLSLPAGLAVGPDGSLYIAESTGERVRRVTPDGIITTIAGSTNGVVCSSATTACGDGGPAIQALFNDVEGVAVAADGTVYIADRNDNRVRKVAPNGIITTVAGTGVFGFNGDGIAATTAQLAEPQGVAVGPDGSLYIADTSNGRIRKVSTTGIITSVVGGGFGFSGDGGPAALAKLNQPWRLHVTTDGSLYIVDRGNQRIRRVTPDGIINTVAGAGGGSGFSGDGGPATLAKFSSPEDVAVAPDGSFYVADRSNERVRLVVPEGIITTVAGNGVGGFSGEGGPATRARLSEPLGLALGAEGRLYVTDSFNQKVRTVQSALPGFSSTDVIIPSDDGTEVYVFDNGGRHLRTVHSLTQTIRYQFGYDGNGLLASVTDAAGNVTTVEHDGSGRPTGILAPFGEHTLLTVNADGYLATVQNPANEQTTLGYTADGLLTSLTNPRNQTWTIGYDSLGRLTSDADPAGGFKLLTRTETNNLFTIAVSTPLQRTNSFEVIRLLDGGRKRIRTDPTGLQVTYDEGPDGSTTNRFPDGSVDTSVPGPDPRWGMLAPVVSTNIVTTPGGLTSVVATVRSVTLTNANDVFSVSAWSETNTINGRAYVSTYVASSRTQTNTSPSGRKIVTTYDALMRPVRSQIVGLEPLFYTYDANGRLSAMVQGTGTLGRTNTFAFNAAGYPVTSTDQLGRQISLAYDGAGRVTSRTLPDNRVIGFAYDTAGNPTAVTPPGRLAHAFAFTPVNLRSLYSPPTAFPGTNSTALTYDLDKELILVRRADGQTLQASYSAAGCTCDRLSATIQPRGTNSFSYDAITGHLTGLSAPDGVGLAVTYDASLLRSETWSGPVAGSVGAAWDNNFRLTSQTVDGANAITLQYDADSLLTQLGSLVLTNDVQTGLPLGGTVGNIGDTWSYNGFSEPVAHSASASGTTFYDANYTRDALGRIVGLTETISGVTNVFAYTYDLAGRLTNVTQNATVVASSSYDSNDNCLSLVTPTSTVTNSYDAQDRLLQSTTVSPPATTLFTYTANGELQSRTTGGQVTTYQYDTLGNLTAVTLPDGTLIQYLIDGQNRRVGKKLNHTLVRGFLYSGQLDCIAELDGAGSLISRFVYRAQEHVPEYMVQNGVTYRFITDQIGSVRLVVNATTGTVAQRLDYDAFGRVLTDTAPGFQPFGFAGGLYDPDTKLVRFGARDYDGEAGRWTAKDPLLFGGQQPNLYAYVSNDPLNERDPAGLGVRVCWSGPLGFHGKSPRPLSHWWLETSTRKRGMGNPNGIIKVEWTDQQNKYDKSWDGEPVFAVQCEEQYGADEACVNSSTDGDLGYYAPGNTCQNAVENVLKKCTKSSAGPPQSNASSSGAEGGGGSNASGAGGGGGSDGSR